MEQSARDNPVRLWHLPEGPLCHLVRFNMSSQSFANIRQDHLWSKQHGTNLVKDDPCK
jgi:hypothetical protein